MKRLLVITGPGGDSQGWGDDRVTETLCQTLESLGIRTRLAYLRTLRDFGPALDRGVFDAVWSALYFLTPRADIIALDENAVWVADLLHERSIPFLGCGAQAMKHLLRKSDTHALLDAHGIAIPNHYRVPPGGDLPNLPFPAFVKPDAESRSIGISDRCVVHTRDELRAQIAVVHTEFQQAALVEEYLPGAEYTAVMLGNGPQQEILPGQVTLKRNVYKQYPILRADLRGIGLTRISIPTERAEEVTDLARRATAALDCHDHVRVDLRVGQDGRLRIIEVNGIPGLKPLKSWSPQLYSLYHPSPEGPMIEYRNMIRAIVEAGFQRLGL